MPLQDALRLADGDVEAAAEHLAKVAVHVRRRGPMVKSADVLSELGDYLSKGYGAVQGAVKPYVPNDTARDALINGLIGAGVGGAGMGALGAVSGKGRRRVLNDALVGALGGGALGAGGTALVDMAPKMGPNVATTGEAKANWDSQYLPGKLLNRALGGAPKDTSAVGDVAGAVGAHPYAAGGAAAYGAARLHDIRRSRPLANFIEGLHAAESAAPGTMSGLQGAAANPEVQRLRNMIHSTQDPMADSLTGMLRRRKLVSELNQAAGKTRWFGSRTSPDFNAVIAAGERAGKAVQPGSRGLPKFLGRGFARGATAASAAAFLPDIISALTGGTKQ